MNYAGTYSISQVGKLFAGVGSINSIKDVVPEYGATAALIITDKGVRGAGLVEKPIDLLRSVGINVEVIDTVPPEPEINHVLEVYNAAKEHSCQVIIGIGGGSVMDVAKIVSVMLTNDVTLRDLLNGAAIVNRGIPTVMAPTTAGTGAEVTQNAIVLVPEEKVKVGIVSSKLVPNCAILDPMMTVKLPAAVTASTGMDALAHAIECYISKKANPFSDTYALRAVSLISGSIRKAYTDGNDIDARHDMLLGAMFGGMCIATSSTTAVHALAYPLGGKYRIPHGLSNAILLPHVMQFNLDAAEEKFSVIAKAMGIRVDGLSTRAAAEKMIANLFSLIKDLGMCVSLKDKGITESDLDGMVEAAAKVKRLLDNNPKAMSKDDIRSIYQKLL